MIRIQNDDGDATQLGTTYKDEQLVEVSSQIQIDFE